MPVYVKGGDFKPAPEGLWDAVCVDVHDLGMKETQWGDKRKLRISWEIAAKMDDGRPFVVNKLYTASLHEKSTLYKDLKAWRGRPFTAEELRQFDVEKVLHAPCKVLVQHDDRDGQTYANVNTVLKADPKHKLAPSGNYVRLKDREGANGAASHDSEYGTEAGEPPEDEDSSIPF